MTPIDLAALELQAKRMRRVRAACGFMKELVAGLFIGCLMASPFIYDIGVLNGWWSK